MRLTRAFFIFLLMTLLPGLATAQANSGFAPIEIRLVAQQAGGGPELAVEGSGQALEVEPEMLLGPWTS